MPHMISVQGYLCTRATRASAIHPRHLCFCHSPAPLVVLPLRLVPRKHPLQVRERAVHEQIVPEIPVRHHIHVPVRLKNFRELPGALHRDDPELVHVPGEVDEAVELGALDVEREVVDHFRDAELPEQVCDAHGREVLQGLHFHITRFGVVELRSDDPAACGANQRVFQGEADLLPCRSPCKRDRHLAPAGHVAREVSFVRFDAEAVPPVVLLQHHGVAETKRIVRGEVDEKPSPFLLKYLLDHMVLARLGAAPRDFRPLGVAPVPPHHLPPAVGLGLREGELRFQVAVLCHQRSPLGSVARVRTAGRQARLRTSLVVEGDSLLPRETRLSPPRDVFGGPFAGVGHFSVVALE
mmetsp:Transcript_12497/g.30333  ORF Transcript_12497/g.30333 Transcript_12497/m.30333 type:complete len:353 (+) Transcript_12497:125-1183(+)